MKKLDSLGTKLCSYQAKIFEESLIRCKCSSKIFLRRFFKSEFAFFLDFPMGRIFTYEIEECYSSLLEQYGYSTYGKEKLNAKALHYLGYLTRYICYTRGVTSGYLYSVIDIYDIVDNYYVYHTQDEEWVISSLLEKQHLTENDLSEDEILKNLLRADFQKQISLLEKEKVIFKGKTH